MRILMSGTTILVILASCLCFYSHRMHTSAAVESAPAHHDFGRSSFPKGFLFGTGTSAYQVEGAAAEDGRLPSVWDTFSHTSGKITDGSNGDIAVDQYHRFKEDIDFLKEMGMDVYRFSISWTRIFPEGSPRHGAVNQAGIEHYNNVINYSLQKGISPSVTLWHWDTPQILEDEYGGWLSLQITEDFEAYAEVCFREFGDRVKTWATVNEPLIVSMIGYDTGMHAPGRCSMPFGNCSAGNSSTEPYIATHNMLLAHSAAVKLYRSKYKPLQNGTIGIALVVSWMLPFSPQDYNATQRAIDFRVGWFMDPLTKGNYPESMRAIVKDRLPCFTAQQSKDLKGSFDWIGLNYYTAQWVIDNPVPASPSDFIGDAQAILTYDVHGKSIGEEEGATLFRSYPPGIRVMIDYFVTYYNNPIMYISETGYVDYGGGNATKDIGRVKYHEDHLKQVLMALEAGANLHGYIVWSLLDNFEWISGYTLKFGLVFVELDNLARSLKESGYWFQDFLSK